MILFITSVIILLFAWLIYHIIIAKPINDEIKAAIKEREKKAEIDKLFDGDAYDYPWQASEDI